MKEIPLNVTALFPFDRPKGLIAMDAQVWQLFDEFEARLQLAEKDAGVDYNGRIAGKAPVMQVNGLNGQNGNGKLEFVPIVNVQTMLQKLADGAAVLFTPDDVVAAVEFDVVPKQYAGLLKAYVDMEGPNGVVLV